MEIGQKFYELLTGALVIIFGLALFPLINGYATTAAANASGTISASFLPFVPWIWAAVVMFVGISMIYAGIKHD